jgi:FlaA1/EpsC-like NDP-sugar epimerase
MRYLEDRVVLVTGAAGSIGSELCRQIVRLRPSRLLLLDTNETGLFELHSELVVHDGGDAAVICIGDITDERRMAQVFAAYRPQIVFHAAAYKHVPLLEAHPGEAVRVNVLGTAAICRTARESGAQRIVFISSDKAVAASNNLGCSKRIGELLVQAYAQDQRSTYCAVRFGNVMGSRGSVIPIFERQIAAGGPITVTHPEATRFFMSLYEAASLVLLAAAEASGGAVYTLDMGQPVSIVGLAETMARFHNLRLGADIEITFTGLRPGEELHEALTTDFERLVPTKHPKIMQVIDTRPVRASGIESAIQDLAWVARHGDPHLIARSLRLVADGLSLNEHDETYASLPGCSF